MALVTHNTLLRCMIAVAARRATNDDKKKLIDSVDCFIFDCDGERTTGEGVGPREGGSLGALPGLNCPDLLVHSLHLRLNNHHKAAAVHQAMHPGPIDLQLTRHTGAAMWPAHAHMPVCTSPCKKRQQQ